MGFLHSPPHPNNELPHCLWPAPPALCPARRALHPAARIPPCPHPSLPARRAVVCPALPSPMQNSSPGTAGLHISSAVGIHQHIPRQLGRMQDVLGHGHGMCQHMDLGRVRARQQDESRCREQPLGLDRTPQWLVMGRKASPHHGHHDPAHGLGVRRAWSNLGLNPTTSRTPRRLLPRTCYPTQPPAPGGSEPGRSCLGVSKESFQDEAAAGTASAALATKGEQPRGMEDLRPERGYLLGLPLPQGTSQLQPPSPWPLPSPAQILLSLHIFGRDRS